MIKAIAEGRESHKRLAVEAVPVNRENHRKYRKRLGILAGAIIRTIEKGRGNHKRLAVLAVAIAEAVPGTPKRLLG